MEPDMEFFNGVFFIIEVKESVKKHDLLVCNTFTEAWALCMVQALQSSS